MKHQPLENVETLGMTDSELATAIALMAQISPQRVPIFRAMLKHEIGYIEISRDTPAFDAWRLPLMPLAVVIGDDDYHSSGPHAFKTAPLFRRWAKRAIIHAAGALPEHYQWLVDAAKACGRAVMVETDAAHWEEWEAFFGAGSRMPLLVIRPTGGLHPVNPSKVDA